MGEAEENMIASWKGEKKSIITKVKWKAEEMED